LSGVLEDESGRAESGVTGKAMRGVPIPDAGVGPKDQVS
jgi:hypothetical protein